MTFNIAAVGKKFNSCLTDDDVLIREFCDAYVEVCGLLSFFGKIFYFVAKDVDEKINILYEYANREPVLYKSVKSMTSHEASVGVSGDVYNKDVIGSRTILRLNRALLFLADLIELLCTAPDNQSLRKLTKDTYDVDLGPYHPWYVRKAVSFAVYSLPQREELISHIIDTQPKDGTIHGKEACRSAMLDYALPAMRTVFDRTNQWLGYHEQLHLP